MSESHYMQRALELAARGQGAVEPNPMVGCVIVREGKVVGEGWHQRFGGPHAEIEALRSAGDLAKGADLFVTLEPCCHFGKTPPCTAALIAAGLRRVVVAMSDPFSQVAGQGIEQLRRAEIEVAVGLLQERARQLNAPYRKLLDQGRPWVIGKWAMTLDGKLATHRGDSRWISNEKSRQVVHQLRGRMDAIVVGRGTVESDNPLLTARPAGVRTATRVVLDAKASLPLDSQLVRTVADAPVLVVASDQADPENRRKLEAAGVDVWIATGSSWSERLPNLLDELGRRRLTNILVEGGAVTLGGFRDLNAIDEYHVFIAPQVIGGESAPGPIAGTGVEQIARAVKLASPVVEILDGDIYVHGRINR